MSRFVNRKSDGGFTLVEMLVALGLLAIASALAVDGFSASRGAARRIAIQDARLRSVTSAEMRLRDRLEAMVVRARFETARPYVDIDGTTDSLAFIAPSSPGAPPTRERLSVNDTGDVVLEDEDGGSDPARLEERLLSGVSAMRIDYYGADANGAAPAWRTDWLREPLPPELVRVRIDFPPGDRRTWPELIVRPVAEVDGDCVIDADTAACRGRS